MDELIPFPIIDQVSQAQALLERHLAPEVTAFVRYAKSEITALLSGK